MSCDSETIELLPPELSQTAGAGSSAPTAGQSAAAGSKPAGGDGHSGGAGHRGGTAGAAGSASCIGLGCSGFNFGGFGGTIWSGNCHPEDENCKLCDDSQPCPEDWHCSMPLGLCVECTTNDHCRQYFACDPSIGRCRPACEDSIDCDYGSVCNREHGTCVQCLDHPDCFNDDDDHTRYCARPQHRCVECLSDPDCDDGTRGICVGGYCIECVFDKHCGPDQHCDVARGRCEP